MEKEQDAFMLEFLKAKSIKLKRPTPLSSSSISRPDCSGNSSYGYENNEPSFFTTPVGIAWLISLFN